ncbi:hypothetical protein [Bacteroides fragilis]|uniref:hypothetical protein n=1 Tax=Bacteroides fragilis TaxID=817 RepID=UPI00370403ED|nr:hypothetical protein [Bacteroides fragilis]MCE8651173.1 hypothetical protein [Bacteroides fragilis]
MRQSLVLFFPEVKCPDGASCKRCRQNSVSSNAGKKNIHFMTVVDRRFSRMNERDEFGYPCTMFRLSQGKYRKDNPAI